MKENVLIVMGPKLGWGVMTPCHPQFRRSCIASQNIEYVFFLNSGNILNVTLEGGMELGLLQTWELGRRSSRH